MWSGKWGLYQDISQGLPQICLHMLAQDLYHVIRLLFVWDTVTPSPHELNGLQKPKSKCQHELSRCFCWLKSKREYNNGNHICQTHPLWRVSQKSGNLGIRKGEPPVERQRVKGIYRPSQHASAHSQEVQFQVLTLHSTSCLDCDLTGMLLSKCVRLIFNTTLVEMLNRVCGLYGCVFLRALLPPLSGSCS